MNKQDEYDDEEFIISRTKKKESMQIYKLMGEELISLSKNHLSIIPLNTEILEALKVAKKIKVGNALNRQMSFIGKLIRNNNFEEIQAALEKLNNQDSVRDQNARQAEKWRDKILEGEANTVGDFIEKYPKANRQKLNQLARHAVKEKAQNDAIENNKNIANKYKKSLFTLLRETINER